jgi:hypothetical protein
VTRNRTLKHVIRARAAKTGERYTTARRHVLNERQSHLQPVARTVVATSPPASKGGLSDAKARETTGHGLAHWFDVLDRFGGVDRGHTALARHLARDHAVPGWHAQGITVAYERSRGARGVNQRCDGVFEVSVSKVIAASTRDIINALSKSRRSWTQGLDAGAVKTLSAALDASTSKGVIVRADGQERFRYAWDETTVQWHLLPKPGGKKVSVVVTNSKLADAAAVERRRVLWRTALDALAKSFA